MVWINVAETEKNDNPGFATRMVIERKAHYPNVNGTGWLNTRWVSRGDVEVARTSHPCRFRNPG
jgi:hypothetical protein